MADMSAYVGGILDAGSTALMIGKWFALGSIVLVIGIIFFMFFINRKKYIYKCELWGSDGGVPDVLMRDTMKPIKVRTKEGISSLLYFKTLKRYLKMPYRDFFRKNKIKFWFRKDGELTPIKPKRVLIIDRIRGYIPESRAHQYLKEAEDNEELIVPLVAENLNQKFAVLQFEFINEDMRLAHVSTAKIIREMFNVEGFFRKFGATILMILATLVFIFGVILILDGVKDYYSAAGSINTGAEKLVERLDVVNENSIAQIEEMKNLQKINMIPVNQQTGPDGT